MDAAADRQATEGRRLLADQIEAYIAHCQHAGHDARHIHQKQMHLARLAEAVGLTRLSDLTADALERHLAALKSAGLSARTLNFARQIAVAFMSWCVKTGRAASNPLRVVPKQDESRDRRRVRRPLTDEELSRLLTVAREHGREAWYLAAVLAGLRKGDLQRLTWADVDFTEATVTVRGGKAKRIDVIPMHAQLADVLRRRFDAAPAVPTAKVFPETVTDRTRQRDFERAGIALEDDEGRVVDLHAMRTTLGTNLARAGVTPQSAQQVMRHADYRTTQKHYTVLGLRDAARAVEALPAIGERPAKAAQATGTAGAAAGVEPCRSPSSDHQLKHQQLGRRTARASAEQCDDPGPDAPRVPDRNPSTDAAFCDPAPPPATICDTPAGVAQLVERQPSKLNVEGSNPFARFVISYFPNAV